jgi:hypothetical protein
MSHYRFVTEWQIDAPIDRVWDAVLDYRGWPTWWKGFTTVEQVGAGDDDGIGMTLRQGWRSLLPYTLLFDLEITNVVRHRRLEGRVSGDVEGTCSWTFDADDHRTRVAFLMDVRTARWWMDIPVPFSRRIFAANFDAIMRWGSEGIGRLLGVGVAHRTADAGAGAD